MARADDDHTTPLSVSGKPFRLTIILLSALVRFLGLGPIKPQHPPLVSAPPPIPSSFGLAAILPKQRT